MGVLNGPTPPENNPPINPQYYKPSRFVISEIDRGLTTIITTAVANNYVVGQLVKTLLTQPNGMIQINNRSAYVLSIISTTQFEIDVDSRNYDPFIAAPANVPTLPQVIAIGDINSGAINNQGRKNNTTFIEGSFINISPN